ncbi:DUF4159 domain-containing protein [bacterium]|nr:DUF4159 domain-containing protein [bacterium]
MSLSFAGESVKIGRLKYSGGGDWYANPSSLPNLIAFANQNLGTDLAPEEDIVAAGSDEIFNYPFIHMTGHGNVILNEEETENLRLYLYSGGFLHIDDNYGMDPYVRIMLKQLFPDKELVELPFDHPIYHEKYNFDNGLPKVHEHDGKAPQGFAIMHENRVLVFYSYETDLGDGWEDEEVHHDPPAIHQKALMMGCNLLQYAFTKN